MAEKEREEEGLISPRTAAAFLANGSPSPCYSVDKAKRKVVGKEWAPNSFSSRFTCMFCSEQFRKDYKLKLHLMMDHKDQPKEMMEKAKEELVKAKLDGCVHMCQICRNKYNSIANFTRHIKDVHQMTRNEYKEQYGDSEVVSRMFTCELCQKEVKHTRFGTILNDQTTYEKYCNNFFQEHYWSPHEDGPSHLLERIPGHCSEAPVWG